MESADPKLVEENNSHSISNKEQTQEVMSILLSPPLESKSAEPTSRRTVPQPTHVRAKSDGDVPKIETTLISVPKELNMQAIIEDAMFEKAVKAQEPRNSESVHSRVPMVTWLVLGYFSVGAAASYLGYL